MLRGSPSPRETVTKAPFSFGLVEMMGDAPGRAAPFLITKKLIEQTLTKGDGAK